MKSVLTSVSFALLSTVLLLGCQDMGSSPVEPVDLSPQFDKKDTKRQYCPDGETEPVGGHCHGEDEAPGGGTWSSADHVHHPMEGVPSYALRESTCPGTLGSKPSNPSVEWKDGEGTGDGCVTVKLADGVRLTNDAYLIVATKRGNYTLQFQIQDIGGAAGTQYRTHRFTIEAPEFTGAGFTLHVHSEVDIYELKGHTGGPEVRNAGAIYISDIEYN